MSTEYNSIHHGSEDACPLCDTVNLVHPETGGECYECRCYILPCNTCPYINPCQSLPFGCGFDKGDGCNMFTKTNKPKHKFKYNLDTNQWEGIT